MNTATKVVVGLLGAAVGVPVGALTGFYVILLFCRVVFGENSYVVAWIIMMPVVPVGAFCGGALGAVAAVMRPRVFAATFIPLAVFFLVLEVSQYYLRRVEQPRLYTLKITTDDILLDAWNPRGRANGRGFVGSVVADGVLHEIKGEIPATFTYRAVRIEYQIALTDAKQDEWYAIEIHADDQDVTHVLTDIKVTGEGWTRGTGWWKRAGGSFHRQCNK